MVLLAYYIIDFTTPKDYHASAECVFHCSFQARKKRAIEVSLACGRGSALAW